MMKKLFLAFLMLCLGMGTRAFAEDVDYTSSIQNPSFETTDGWTTTNVGSRKDGDENKFDSNGLYETTGWGANATGSVTQTITGLPAGRYELNFVYMAAEGTCRVKVTANEQTTGELTGTGTANGNTGITGWHRVALTVYVYDGTLKITAEGKNGSDTQVWTNIDDFHLVLKEQFTDKTSSITNPKADGNINGWTGTDGNVKYNESNDDVRFEGGLFELCNWGSSWDLTLSQSLFGLSNGEYKLTCVWQSNTTIEVKANDATSGTLTGHGTTGGNTNIAGWDYVEVPVTVTDGNLIIAVHGTANSSEKWANIDNFHLLYYPVEKTYTIGEPTLNDVNGILPGQRLGIQFPEAYTDDIDVTLTLDPSKVTIDGVASITVEDGEFVFTVPAGWELGSVHTATIAAGAAKYGEHASNEASTINFSTATVLPGTYFFGTSDGKYLARGADHGAHALVNDYGTPVQLIAKANNEYYIQFVDSKQYLYNSDYSIWCDKATTDASAIWTITKADGNTYKLHSTQQDAGKYVKLDAGNPRLFSNGSTAVNWSIITPTERNLAATKAAKLAEAVTLKSTAEAKTDHKTYSHNKPTATAEQFQNSGGDHIVGEILNKEITVYPGIYKFAIHAFQRIASNDVAYGLHEQNGADAPIAYIYFDDVEIPVKSVFDENIEGSAQCYVKNEKNYPNQQSSALRGFQQGLYLNIIYARVTEEKTINYGIKKVSNPKGNAHWTCYATDGIEVTRYYDRKTDGFESSEAEEIYNDNIYIPGDTKIDENITIADVAGEVRAILNAKQNSENTKGRYNVLGNATADESDVAYIADILLGKKDQKALVDNRDNNYNYSGTINAAQTTSKFCQTNQVMGLVDGKDLISEKNPAEVTTRINVTTEGISNIASISVYAKGKEQIAGPMTVDYKDGLLSNLTTSAGTASGGTIYTNGNTLESDVVRLETSESSATLYLRPVTLSQGVTVTVQTTDGNFYSQDLATVNVGKDNAVTVNTANNNGAWMATIPGTIGFTALSLAGAHDAATSSCSASTAKCQSKTITELLNAGVRALDLRPKGTSKNSLTIYHGSYTTSVKFETALENVKQYLIDNPSEMVVLTIHDEAASSGTDLENWGSAITAWLQDYSDYIKVIDSNVGNNKLADCRGKMVVITRDAISSTNLAVKTGWPDNASSTSELTYCSSGSTGITLKFQDEYDNRDTGTRLTAIENFQSGTVPNDGNRYVVTINGTNIAWKLTEKPTTYPKDYAKTINAAIVNSTTFTDTNKRFGIVMGDYMGDSSCSGDALLKLIINQNYKYVFNGLGK